MVTMNEYKPGSAFPGVIGRTVEESQPAWPEPLRPKPDAPNVLFIVLDGVGFGQLGCFGSPIRTPNLNKLAAGGLRYNNMHTTALCSPTRSCILTGRNHHSNAMSCITEGSLGYPGSNGYIPFENGFLSEILQRHGYNTYAVGKWHLTPAEQTSAAEPRPQLARDRKIYIYFPGTSAVPENVAARVLNRPHSITADVETRDGDQGVLLCHGGIPGGYSLFIKDRKLHYVHNYVGAQEYHVESREPVPPGRVELRYEFDPTGPPDIAHGRGARGRGQLYFNGTLVGQAEIPVTVPLVLGLGDGLSCGRDVASAVTTMYHAPFPFTGTIHQVTVDVSGRLIEDKEKQMQAVMARQ